MFNMDSPDELIARIERILRRAGFKTARIRIRGGCFDLVGSGNVTLFFIKTSFNVDTVTEEQAMDLKVISSLFHASPLIVGVRSRGGELEVGVVYERFGIYTLKPETLEEILIGGEPPLVFAERGGLYVKINGKHVRRLRERLGYSVNEFARLLGVSRKSVLNYERGERAVSLEIALQMEEIFNEPIAEPIDILRRTVAVKIESRPKDEFEAEVLGRFKELGMSVVKVKKAPFNAVSKSEDVTLLTGVDKKKTLSTLRRAEMVAKVGSVLGSEGLFVLRKTKTEVVENVPIIPESVLKKVRDREELVELIEELKKELPPLESEKKNEQ